MEANPMPASIPLPKKKDESNGEYPLKPKSKEPLATATSQPMKPVAQEMYHDSFMVDGKDYDLTIPMPACQVMKDVLELSDEVAQTFNDVLCVAMLLFLDYADAATTMAESAGGDGSVESDWGRKKYDDEQWTRCCARKAAWLCKLMRRTFKR